MANNGEHSFYEHLRSVDSHHPYDVEHGNGQSDARWNQEVYGDDDVPASLLVEHQATLPTAHPPPSHRTTASQSITPQPRDARSKLPEPTADHPRYLPTESQASQPTKPLDTSHLPPALHASMTKSTSAATATLHRSREEALWRWANVTNLDKFLQEVYDFYQGHGLWCILSDRVLHLVESSFIATLLTFLTQCIDYSKISTSDTLPEVLIPKCTQKMSTLWNVGLWIYVFYFIWKCVQYVVDIRRLLQMRDFYTHLLSIPEQDMQTVSWQDVVCRFVALRDANAKTADLRPSLARYVGSQSKARLDAHDIANRLMRRDNFFIALMNKEILDISLPIPFFGRRAFFSRTLEWYLQYSILDLVFASDGQVHAEFLKPQRRRILSQKLKQRFYFAAALNLLFAPFVLAYLVVVYFFTYYNEYQQNPSQFGTRRYTPLAEWKFREFNELQHLFDERINMSYPFATRYINQFPKKATERVAQTVTFVTGALVAVLAIASLLDEKMFLGFEITPDRTVLFYLGVLGVVWKAARDTIAEETLVFNPEYAMQNVIEYTHYAPESWKDRLHSYGVNQEFSELYKLKPILFAEELLGIIATPLLLLFSLPPCSDQIIDFFREFTVHVDGLGYVCSFAVFDFKKGVGRGPGRRDIREDYYSAKHNKMATSFHAFLDNYVINPKTGIPGHNPANTGGGVAPRHPWRPERPPFLGGLAEHSAMEGNPMASKTSARAPAVDHRDRVRPWSTHTARAGGVPPMPQASPMASLLLDPHHQPSAQAIHSTRNAYHPDVIEEVVESNQEVDPSPPSGLDESAWEPSSQHSAAHGESSSSSGTTTANHNQGRQDNLLGMIYQFQKAQQKRRGASVL